MVYMVYGVYGIYLRKFQMTCYKGEKVDYIWVTIGLVVELGFGNFSFLLFDPFNCHV